MVAIFNDIKNQYFPIHMETCHPKHIIKYHNLWPNWKRCLAKIFKRYLFSNSETFWSQLWRSNMQFWMNYFKVSYNLGQNCWDKIENLFFREKTPLPPSQCCWQSFRLLATKLGQSQHWYWGVRGRIWNFKNWVISWIYWIFNFCLNKFCPGL